MSTPSATRTVARAATDPNVRYCAEWIAAQHHDESGEWIPDDDEYVGSDHATFEAAGEPATLWAEYYKRGKALARTFPYTHVVFGFDCAHYRDNKDSALHDASYVFNLAQRMRESILAAIQRRNAP